VQIVILFVIVVYDFMMIYCYYGIKFSYFICIVYLFIITINNYFVMMFGRIFIGFLNNFLGFLLS
jgi:hypothetical protein